VPLLFGIRTPIEHGCSFIRLNLIPVDKLHITLLYLGDVRADLSRVEIRHKPFTVLVGEMMFLPSPSNPRAVALKVIKGVEELTSLRGEIIHEVAKLGLKIEDKHLEEFVPHITIARIREKRLDVRELKEELKCLRRFRRRILVDAVELMDSAGGEYRTLIRWSLRS